jgi:hypothetical protein
MTGLDDIRLSLAPKDIADGENVSIAGEIEVKSLTNLAGTQYRKYVIPVEKSGEVCNLWVFEKDAGKIVKACGKNLKDYFNAELTLGIEDSGKKGKEGQALLNIVIRDVKPVRRG